MNTNRLFYILAGVIAFVVFLTVIIVLRNLGGGAVQESTLQFWGVFDNRSVYDPIIRNFQAQNPSIKVVYREFNFEDYERSLTNALAAGTGPDIFMFHNGWLPKHGDKVSAMPEVFSDDSPSMTVGSFQQQFVDVAAQDLVYTNRIYALPLYVDTLALYYNKDILNSAGITRPAQTWEEFNSDVETITRLDESGAISQSAAAIGTARNINRSTDILVGLMLQSGVQMIMRKIQSRHFQGRLIILQWGDRPEILYRFANPSVRTYTWNDSQHYSMMCLCRRQDRHDVQLFSPNSGLESKVCTAYFGVAPIPQVSPNDAKTYANYGRWP